MNQHNDWSEFLICLLTILTLTSSLADLLTNLKYTQYEF